MNQLRDPFIGSEALACGAVSRHQLRTRYRAVFPGVYAQKLSPLSLHERIVAAWLWSGRRATIAGLAAAALHGAKWIDDDVVVDLIYANPKPPPGIRTRRAVLLDGERQVVRGRAVTSPARTAFDLGREGRVDAAVERLDALVRATALGLGDVADLARHHPGVRGLRQLETAVDLVDSGAESPKETWLRLLIMRAGLPRPRTQIPVLGPDGAPFAFLDMGWENCMVAMEYDGEHHQTSRWVYTKDIRRAEKIDAAGWLVVRVVREDHPVDIVRRVRHARALRSASVL
ncbi:hypothetical protein [Mycolicibacterium litorale]|uniref:DUF559 domain-containing protein n=1 Tax=Mycolicibacterium litorale TaxID=758802 RepID=A0AAD1IMS9_9MYCO|nr:hypothetical protein [Mycolicibacterium litorale]MCV7416808.1 hypothetical protein [Mycolicibacterium litorale]TDY04593.1 hypothetical protein BCL50_3368 [Mycolicibacterium litorale]BBY18019.1 hypothetical protein MLIT_36110 [Mycolicibacterium litorale]